MNMNNHHSAKLLLLIYKMFIFKLIDNKAMIL